jgi:hypothetical protein
MNPTKKCMTQSPSISPDMEAEYREFSRKVFARLEVGAKEYGDGSFHRPESEVLGELQQELEDVAGWGYILWARIQRLRFKLDQ